MTLIDKAEALLPCPFCGNDDIQDWGESTWSRPVKWMYCTECQARGPRVMLGRGEPKDHWHHRIREEWNRRALPARGVGADAVLDAAHAYLVQQYGHSALAHPIDRARILAALEPALAPTDAAQAREAALREAAEVVDAALMRWGFPSTDGCKRDEMRSAILALIGEDRT